MSAKIQTLMSKSLTSNVSFEDIGVNNVPTRHWCLAPYKSVINYGPLTEPKFYIAKSGRTQISTSNDHISETKQDFFRSAGAKIGQQNL